MTSGTTCGSLQNRYTFADFTSNIQCFNGLRLARRAARREWRGLCGVEGAVDVADGAFAGDDLAGVAENDGHGGDVEVDVGAGGDEGVVADGDVADQDGVGADPDAVFEGGRAGARAAAGGADGDAVRDVDVGAEDRAGADDHSAEVAEVEAGTDARGGRDVEAVAEAVAVVEDAVEEIGEDGEGALAAAVVGGAAQIEGEAEAGFAQIGRAEGARAGLPAVAEEVGAQGLPEVGWQGRSLHCRRVGRDRQA